MFMGMYIYRERKRNLQEVEMLNDYEDSLLNPTNIVAKAIDKLNRKVCYEFGW